MLRLDAPEAPGELVTAADRRPGAPARAGQGVAVWAARASVLLALLPILVATVRAVASGWLPVGDNAYFAIRARDVFTEHHPLLGTWTSASISAGTNFNNPGPLLFDLLAGPAKLVGGGAGVAIGAALVNTAAVIVIAIVALRRGGPVLCALAMVVAAALSWTMGSELLFDPWQPHSLLLTSLLLVALVWSVASGDVVLAPLTAGLASLVVQTHLSYAVIVASLGAWALVGLSASLRRLRRTDPGAWPRLRRRSVRSLGVAAVVLVACWAQPIVEQVAGEGAGNITRLAESAGGSAETVGIELGTRIVAGVVTSPPGLVRPSFERALQPSDTGAEVRPGVRLPALPSTAVAAASLALLAALLVGLVVLTKRLGDRAAMTAAVTAAVALVGGLATAASLPIGFSGIAPHQFRWLWPLTAFTALALLVPVVRSAATTTRRTTVVTVVAAGFVLVLSAVNLPAHNVGAGPSDDAWAIPVVRELGERMEALEGEGPLLIDMRGIRFAEPYSGPVMAELQRREIPFVVDDEGMVRQLGPSRRAGPDAQRLFIREGEAARTMAPGQRRAVFVEGLDDAEQAELDQLSDAVVAHLEELGAVPLNARGRAALERGDLTVAASRPEVLTSEPSALLATRELGFMVERDLLDLSAVEEERFDRYAALQRASDYETVALFLAPLDADPVVG